MIAPAPAHSRAADAGSDRPSFVLHRRSRPRSTRDGRASARWRRRRGRRRRPRRRREEDRRLGGAVGVATERAPPSPAVADDRADHLLSAASRSARTARSRRAPVSRRCPRNRAQVGVHFESFISPAAASADTTIVPPLTHGGSDATGDAAGGFREATAATGHRRPPWPPRRPQEHEPVELVGDFPGASAPVRTPRRRPGVEQRDAAAGAPRDLDLRRIAPPGATPLHLERGDPRALSGGPPARRRNRKRRCTMRRRSRSWKRCPDEAAQLTALLADEEASVFSSRSISLDQRLAFTSGGDAVSRVSRNARHVTLSVCFRNTKSRPASVAAGAAAIAGTPGFDAGGETRFSKRRDVHAGGLNRQPRAARRKRARAATRPGGAQRRPTRRRPGRAFTPTDGGARTPTCGGHAATSSRGNARASGDADPRRRQVVFFSRKTVAKEKRRPRAGAHTTTTQHARRSRRRRRSR